ncbi:F-box only protein 15 [Thalassophryne amazonica]|uniref:F-box only protein 15 n=1 Tax=Thalassophryne amazonica TaxID=390379 RepID=UPI00147156FD|nr:F-box only protein 15 [Thalassophryne amazonica]
MPVSKPATFSRWAVRMSRRADKSSSASPQSCLERLPSEILIKILSYLDAGALFSISHVNKRLYHLASDNNLWKEIYNTEFGRHRKLNPKDQRVSCWKLKYMRTVALCDLNNWDMHLRHISRYTGLPADTEMILRNLQITWELTATDKSGREVSHEQSWSQFFETSVVLGWNGACMPDSQRISTLQVHGVKNISPISSVHRVAWRSLMVKLDMTTVSKNPQIIGEDSVVQLVLLHPGIITGIWKERPSIAFVIVCLHLHQLVEKSILGSFVSPYVNPEVKAPFDDLDPGYGLHGYQLHIVLHNTVRNIMTDSYSQLCCRRTEVHDGIIELIAVSRTDLSKHTALSGNIILPWRCEVLSGTVENCCIISGTLLDEFHNPFWCFTAPVSMKLMEKPVSYDYDGDHFLIHYQDSHGQVKMAIVWLKEQKQFYLVSLVVYLSIHKVNVHFGRNY